jgi:hypothetical protein
VRPNDHIGRLPGAGPTLSVRLVGRRWCAVSAALLIGLAGCSAGSTPKAASAAPSTSGGGSTTSSSAATPSTTSSTDASPSAGQSASAGFDGLWAAIPTSDGHFGDASGNADAGPVIATPVRFTTDGGTTTVTAAVLTPYGACRAPVGLVLGTFTKAGSAYSGSFVNMDWKTCKKFLTIGWSLTPIPNPQDGNTAPSLKAVAHTVATDAYSAVLIKCPNEVPDADQFSSC